MFSTAVICKPVVWIQIAQMVYFQWGFAPKIFSMSPPSSCARVILKVVVIICKLQHIFHQHISLWEIKNDFPQLFDQAFPLKWTKIFRFKSEWAPEKRVVIEWKWKPRSNVKQCEASVYKHKPSRKWKHILYLCSFRYPIQQWQILCLMAEVWIFLSKNEERICATGCPLLSANKLCIRVSKFNLIKQLLVHMSVINGVKQTNNG